MATVVQNFRHAQTTILQNSVSMHSKQVICIIVAETLYKIVLLFIHACQLYVHNLSDTVSEHWVLPEAPL